jgi:hypothetical protein
VSPDPDVRHQNLVGELDTILHLVIAWPGYGQVLPGTKISDRDQVWMQNYRVPDLVV